MPVEAAVVPAGATALLAAVVPAGADAAGGSGRRGGGGRRGSRRYRRASLRPLPRSLAGEVAAPRRCRGRARRGGGLRRVGRLAAAAGGEQCGCRARGRPRKNRPS